jgi:hypothetical protein
MSNDSRCLHLKLRDVRSPDQPHRQFLCKEENNITVVCVKIPAYAAIKRARIARRVAPGAENRQSILAWPQTVRRRWPTLCRRHDAYHLPQMMSGGLAYACVRDQGSAAPDLPQKLHEM